MPLRQLYPDPGSTATSDAAKVDIIAVHGLNPRSKNDPDHAWDTWRTPAGTHGRLWLRDDLPQSVPESRIFLYEYNSTAIYGKDRGTFIQKASELLEAIRIERDGVESRPILFLGHSMGGLLVKQALINAHNNPKYTPIKDATTGLAFFATPHHGGDWMFVSLGSVAAKIATAIGFQKGDDVVETLKEGSIFSDIMQEHWRHQLLKYDLVSFWGDLDNVVPSKSAQLGMPGDRENVVKLSADHRTVCKFGPSQTDQDNLKLARGNIRDLYRNALKIAEQNGLRRWRNVSESADKEARVSDFLNALYTSPYQDRKDRNPERVAGTCEWFTHHSLLRHWQESTVPSLLWVSADPGCGKSVLAKYLVDEALQSTQSWTTCYFFFKGDYDDQRSPESALCCILRQLFLQRPDLLTDSILKQFQQDRQRILGSFHGLWDILINIAVGSACGEIVCVLDALDECDDQGRSQLVKALCDLYWPGTSNLTLKFLVTSRPYVNIQREFQGLKDRLPTIHFAGENEDEIVKISREIDLVIRSRVEDISRKLRLRPDERRVLGDELVRIPNRTYLWVYLICDEIEHSINITPGNIRADIGRLPKSIEEAYENILCRSRDLEKARRLLHIVVAAERPLSLQEMSFALAFRESHRVYRDVEVEPEDRFRSTVRELCGLFVTVKDSKIYLLHQTAKEFLVQRESSRAADPLSNGSLTSRWKHTLPPAESNRILAEICIRRLLITEFQGRVWEIDASFAIFLSYSAEHWTTHFRQAHVEKNSTLIGLAAQLCDLHSPYRSVWVEPYEASLVWPKAFPAGSSLLIIASYFGLDSLVEPQLNAKEVDLNQRGGEDQRPALSWAAENGHEAVVKLLLERAEVGVKGILKKFQKSTVQVNAKDKHGRTALLWAVRRGHETIVRLLLDKAANVEAMGHGRYDMTPLSEAAEAGHYAIFRLLLDRGASIEAKCGWNKQTPLSHAASFGHEAIVQLLLDKGAAIDTMSNCGMTPLSYAANHGHGAVVQLLLNKGADTEGHARAYKTPLCYAAEHGHTAIAQLLLAHGADIEAKATKQTPLARAAEKGHEVVVQMLLDKGANIEAKDQFYAQTPLLYAARNGHAAVVRLLLDRGADIDAAAWQVPYSHKGTFITRAGWNSQTPLSHAAERGHEAVVQLLLSRGADIDAKAERNDQTPLSYAAANGHETV